MHRRLRSYLCLSVFAMMAALAVGQNATPEPSNAVPNQINYSSVLKDSTGKIINSVAGVTFLIYKDEEGGSPLWQEIQNVTPDETGHYSVQLGATNTHGLPANIFQNGAARWLAVQPSGEPEQARTLLVAVPYALKAQDAATIGGLPPSAFVLAGGNSATNASPGVATQSAATNAKVPPPGLSNVTTNGGTANSVPLFTTATNVQNSMIIQKNNLIGIGQASPAATLDVNGTANFSGTITAPSLFSFTSNAYNVFSVTSAPTGTALFGQTNSQTNQFNSYGVYGSAVATSGNAIGVYGRALNTSGIGVFGQFGKPSYAGSTYFGGGFTGVWGDGGPGTSAQSFGVAGTVDDGVAGMFMNNSNQGNYTVDILALNNSWMLEVLAVNGGDCFIDNNGDLSCSGTTSSVVPLDGGKRSVALSAIESPVNWFEDAGEARLVNGRAVVRLDADFIQTVNTARDYKVFPVPNGDCSGLYVTNKTATSFEVRELGGGSSSVAFDYRIMALRRNYENVRFDDRAEETHHAQLTREKLKAKKSAAGLATSSPAPSPIAERVAQ